MTVAWVTLMSEIHLIIKWNPFADFHPLAPATIPIHLTILDQSQKTGIDAFVWWGKISKSGRIGVNDNDIKRVNVSIRKYGHTYLYLYCPDGPRPSLHVAKVVEISSENKSLEFNTPSYYKDLDYPVRFWFKILDMCTVDLKEITNLQLEDGTRYDPVSAVSYPLIVKQLRSSAHFTRDAMYQDLLAGIQNYSNVFICYGEPDAEIATAINARLKSQGIETWFFPDDAPPGEKLHRVMSTGISTHARTLLICSKASLSRSRSGVLNELERVMELEAKEGGSTRLIPITIDQYVYEDWAPERGDLADQIRSRVICECPNDAELKDEFENVMQKIISVLKT